MYIHISNYGFRHGYYIYILHQNVCKITRVIITFIVCYFGQYKFCKISISKICPKMLNFITVCIILLLSKYLHSLKGRKPFKCNPYEHPSLSGPFNLFNTYQNQLNISSFSKYSYFIKDIFISKSYIFILKYFLPIF